MLFINDYFDNTQQQLLRFLLYLRHIWCMVVSTRYEVLGTKYLRVYVRTVRTGRIVHTVCIVHIVHIVHIVDTLRYILYILYILYKLYIPYILYMLYRTGPNRTVLPKYESEPRKSTLCLSKGGGGLQPIGHKKSHL